MACNCKRARDFEEKNGIPLEENVLKKATRYFFKALFFVIAIGLTIVLTPIILLWAAYAIFFGNNRIVLPKFLGKYLENGKKL